MVSQMSDAGVGSKTLPEWVPTGAVHYIEHTEKGAPIRALARAAGCHASTILRQIRKVEMRRDDPLVDAALRKLGAATDHKAYAKTRQMKQGKAAKVSIAAIPCDATLAREAMRVLRRMCETGAVLAVAEGLDKAVVVRDGPDGGNARTAVVDASVAQAMALKDWITPSTSGRIIRYQITGAGRTALNEYHESFGGNSGTSAGDDLSPVPAAYDDMNDARHSTGRSRFSVAESPLSALARRRDKDGKRFLDDTLVQSGERLREDFELAQMDASVTQNWDHFLTAGTGNNTPGAGSGGTGPAAARARVQAALTDLGPGLSDVVLRCCCYLEGLETTEKRLGWSARSGKVVLRIALMRLKRHYDETVGPGGPMIG